jgi:DNA polymerase-3 subunit epsilon
VELASRSARALRPVPAPGRLGGWLPAEAVAEARLVGAWVAANRPPSLELTARTGEAAHAAFLARIGCRPATSSPGGSTLPTAQSCCA